MGFNRKGHLGLAKRFGTWISETFKILCSFNFDGVNDRLVIPNTELESYFAGTNDFTVSALFNINSLSTHQGVFGNENLANGLRTFDIIIFPDGRVICQNYTSGFKSLDSTVGDVSINEWVLITVVVDKSNQSNSKIYKNGVPLVITSNTLPSNFTTYAYNYNIGDAGNGQFPLNGNISQVSVIDRTLSGAEVLDLYNNGKPKNPVSVFGDNCKYFFNPDKAYAFDSVNSEWGVPDSVNVPEVSRSFTFDGVNDYIGIPNAIISPIIQGSNKKFTLNFTIKRLGGLATDSFFGQDGGVLFVRVTTGGTLEFYAQFGGSFKKLRVYIDMSSTTEWYNISIAFDGPNSKIFVDGVEPPILSNNLLSNIDVNTGDFALGRRNTGIMGNVLINQFSILDTAITLAQHTDWYNNGKPKNPFSVFGDDCKYFFNPDKTYAFDSVNSEWGVPDSVNVPEVSKSFTFDGVSNYMVVPKEDLSSHISGTGKSFSMSFAVKRGSIGGYQGIFGSNNFFFRFQNNNILLFNFVNSANVNKLSYWSNTYLSTAEWLFITVTYDSSLSVGNRSELMVNGVLQTKTIDTAEDNLFIPVSDYWVGRARNYELNGGVNQFSILDTAITLAQHTDWYNNGKPKNPQVLFGTNCKYFFNPDDAVWNGSIYTVTDSVNSATATSANMIGTELKYRAPGVAYSQNMIGTELKYRAPGVAYSQNMDVADKDCNSSPY